MRTSATAPGVILLLGVIAFFFVPALGALLLGLGVVLLIVRVITAAATARPAPEKICSACARSVNAEAVVCRHCGTPFPTAAK